MDGPAGWLLVGWYVLFLVFFFLCFSFLFFFLFFFWYLCRVRVVLYYACTFFFPYLYYRIESVAGVGYGFFCPFCPSVWKSDMIMIR